MQHGLRLVHGHKMSLEARTPAGIEGEASARRTSKKCRPDASEARARTRETTLSDIVGYITVSRVGPLVQSSRVAHAIIYNYTSPRH